MTTQEELPSETVGQQVKKLRVAHGWKAGDLAERCEQVGAPELTAQAIFNIENGRKDKKTGRRRRSVTVDELPLLARALGVPPLLLLFPVGTAENVEVLPGRQLPTWQAAKWFTGEEPMDTYTGGHWVATSEDAKEWRQGAAPLDLQRWHDRYVEQWNQAKRKVADHRGRVDMAEDEDERTVYQRRAARAEREAADVEQQLGRHRAEMRRHGLKPGDLADNLKHVDELGEA